MNNVTPMVSILASRMKHFFSLFRNLRPKLVNNSELPKWLMDNPYIIGWCREPDLTFGQCVLSLVQLHNQTMNIWTHLAGLLYFQYELVFAFPSHLTDFKGNHDHSCSYMIIVPKRTKQIKSKQNKKY